jgi:PAS domain S-box-containing protein
VSTRTDEGATPNAPARYGNRSAAVSNGTARALAETMHATDSLPGTEPRPDYPVLLWEADPETFEITYVSRGADHLIGSSLDQSLTRPMFWVERLHPDDRATAVAICHTAVADGHDHHLAYRILATDGRVVRVRDVVRAVHDGDRTLIRGAMIEVRDPSSADASSAGPHVPHVALLERIPDAIIVTTPDGRIVYEAASIEFVTGYRPGLRTGQSIFDAAHPNDLPRLLQVLERAAASDEPTAPVQFRHRHAGGDWRTLEAIGRSSADGQQPLVIVSARDVTDRLVLEERTNQAEKMEALERLTRTIAHDFNNLLTTILGHADKALAVGPGAALRADLDAIRQAADVGATLVRQLAPFSDTRVKIANVVDVPDTLQRLGGVLRGLVGPPITLTVETMTGPAHVHLEEGHLEQIVMNLVLNARDAMPWGGTITVTVTASSKSPGGRAPRDLITIEVSDTGVGMTAHVRARIFEPYFTTKAVGKGTGLGLSTVYGLVTEAGGSVEVESEIDQGSRFSVHLPRALPLWT